MYTVTIAEPGGDPRVIEFETKAGALCERLAQIEAWQKKGFRVVDIMGNVTWIGQGQTLAACLVID